MNGRTTRRTLSGTLVLITATAAAVIGVAHWGPAHSANGQPIQVQNVAVNALSQQSGQQGSDSETAARDDLLSRLAGDPGIFITGMVDDENPPLSMDTAKIIQTAPNAYLAVYADGPNFVVKLATSSNLRVWHYVVALDSNASQPYIAEADGGSFVFADEKQDLPGSPTSHLYFVHYPNLQALLNDQPDKTLAPYNEGRFFSSCNEGTPDIHGLSADGLSFSFGFHYLADCPRQLDQEAFGTITNFHYYTASQDTVRDNAVNLAKFPGKHGGRDDITWQGWRFSLQESQNSSANLGAYTSWRYVLYDYSNQTAYPVKLTPPIIAPCQGNPKLTVLNDPNGDPVILVTGFIFAGSAGCTQNQGGEFLYTVPAR
jgi:hypothetical protein